MGCCGSPFADGMRFLLDQNQMFQQAGPPVYVRIRGFTDAQEVDPAAEELGFIVATAAEPTGTTDTQIVPPPSVKVMSQRNIQQAMLAGLQLTAGARTFKISHSWVLAQMAARNFTRPEQVFDDDTTIGFVVEGQLMSIVSREGQIAYGQYISWLVTGSAAEGG
jgi:hypothetical protein